MRSPRLLPALFATLAALAIQPVPSVRAQAMQEWSAIEVRPLAGQSRKTPGSVIPAVPVATRMAATVAVSGPAAGLLPNATQPAASARLKGPSAPLLGVLGSLTQLRPVRFEFLPGQGEEGAQYGLLPADLARVYPELVRTNLMNGTQTINTAQLTPLLVEAIKELNAQMVLLQGQQMQLAEAYARLVEQRPARASAGLPTFLRRNRAPAPVSVSAPGPDNAPDSPADNAPDSPADNAADSPAAATLPSAP